MASEDLPAWQLLVKKFPWWWLGTRVEMIDWNLSRNRGPLSTRNSIQDICSGSVGELSKSEAMRMLILNSFMERGDS